jgi:hypothetical protein
MYIRMLGIANLSGLLTALAGIGFLGQFTIFLQIPVIILKICGYSTFRVRNDRDVMKSMLKFLDTETYSSSSIYEYGKERPAGVFIGWNCFGYYMDGSNREFDSSTEIVIFTSVKVFKKLIEKCTTSCESMVLTKDNCVFTSTTYPIKMWHRWGGYKNLYYTDFKIDVSTISPLGEQGPIVRDIIDKYRAERRLITFVHGVTGAGKSTLGLLIAKELGGGYCRDFKPTDPGDSFRTVLRDTRNDSMQSGPIVVVMEEFDTLIQAVHNGTVERHKEVTTQVHDKESYNKFLDEMMIYRDILVIMTSNKKKEDIDKMDPSYLRKGRINSYYSMTVPLVT